MNSKIIRDIIGMNFTQTSNYFNTDNNFSGSQGNTCPYCNTPFQITFTNNRGYLLGKCKNPRCPKYNSLQYVK